MNVDIDQMLDKWADLRNTISSLEKKADNYKKIMKQYLAQNGTKKYENTFFKVSLSTHDRTSVQKKDVPKEVWDMYAKSKSVEYLTLTEKKSKPRQQQQQQSRQQQLR